jgi:hypothetical protein
MSGEAYQVFQESIQINEFGAEKKYPLEIVSNF